MSEYSEAVGKLRIAYDDGPVENIQVKEENWHVFSRNQVGIPEITSIKDEALHEYFKTAAHKEFVLHQAEGLPTHPLWNAHGNEE